MDIAALVSFGILLVAWILAPNGPRPTPAVEEAPMPEAQPTTA